MKEVDLYKPLECYFSGQGYQVAAEVLHTDMVITKNGQTFGIELKLRFSLELVYQLLNRRGQFDGLYGAIPCSSSGSGSQKIPKQREILMLLSALGIGLIGVHLGEKKTQIHILLQANQDPRHLATRHRDRKKILGEIDGRFAELGPGGVPGTTAKLTAYRQQALFILWIMNHYPGADTPKKLRALGAHPVKTQTILLNNVYGWFVKESRGVYSVSPAGRQALESYDNPIQSLESRWIEIVKSTGERYGSSTS